MNKEIQKPQIYQQPDNLPWENAYLKSLNKEINPNRNLVDLNFPKISQMTKYYNNYPSIINNKKNNEIE